MRDLSSFFSVICGPNGSEERTDRRDVKGPRKRELEPKNERRIYPEIKILKRWRRNQCVWGTKDPSVLSGVTKFSKYVTRLGVLLVLEFSDFLNARKTFGC